MIRLVEESLVIFLRRFPLKLAVFDMLILWILVGLMTPVYVTLLAEITNPMYMFQANNRSTQCTR